MSSSSRDTRFAIERAESATMGGLGIGMEVVRLVAGEGASMLSSGR
jgi:hypothetical protein